MWLYHRVMSPNFADGIANSVDPDQTALLGAVWSASALFAQAYLSENLGSLRYRGAERHETCESFENAASIAKTNVIMTNEIKFPSVHDTDDDVSFCDGPGMLIHVIRNTAKPYFNSTWIALLIHGYMPVKTRLLIACDTAFYAIMTFTITLVEPTTLGDQMVKILIYINHGDRLYFWIDFCYTVQL